jgi:hypothetical protein
VPLLLYRLNPMSNTIATASGRWSCQNDGSTRVVEKMGRLKERYGRTEHEAIAPAQQGFRVSNCLPILRQRLPSHRQEDPRR